MRWLPVALALVGSSVAFASVEGDLAKADTVTTELSDSANALDRRIVAGRTYLSPKDALTAFEENLFLHLIGKNRSAAEGFFALVTTGALEDPNLHRDAEWHLAESLFAMGNVVTAEARFIVIAEDDSHPFREDAVRRLLEVYSDTHETEKFYALYESEIVQGRVKPTPLITYTIAKSFYRQDEFLKAISYFQDIPAGQLFHPRARYFMGVIAIREGRIEDAERFFQEASNGSVNTVESRKVHDLALLALARLAYERSDFATASDYYQQIGGDSVYLADILYETAWSNIKQSRFDHALQSVDLFLLAFPEHRYSGELRVIQGHLHMGCAQVPEKCPNGDFTVGPEGDSYEKALAAYESIVIDYTPIRERFQTLASSTDEPKAYFEKVLAIDQSDSETGVPEFALSMMRNDPELERALGVYEALTEQLRDVASSEQMIADLQAALDSNAGLGGFEGARYEAIVNQNRTVQQQVALLDIEMRWLEGLGISVGAVEGDMSRIRELTRDTETKIQTVSQLQQAHVAKVTTLQGSINTVEMEVEITQSAMDDLRAQLAENASMTGSERRGVEDELSRVEASLGTDRTRLGELRVELTKVNMPSSSGQEGLADKSVADAIASLRTKLTGLRKGGGETGREIDQLHDRLSVADGKYRAVLGRIDGLAESEYGRLRERFRAEVVEVASQRKDLDQTSADSEGLSVRMTREGFGRMEDFFADSVLRADMGIVDVYWARKVEIADQRERIQDERNALVAELQRRFVLIRQKMEQ